MAQEGELWAMALEPSGLRRAAASDHRYVDSRRAAPPPRPVVEHLSIDKVSQEVMNILKIAQERVGAFVPDRVPAAGTVTLYARHASNFVDGLIMRLPKEQLSRALLGSCIEIKLGV
jgi:hypothetical protein